MCHVLALYTIHALGTTHPLALGTTHALALGTTHALALGTTLLKARNTTPVEAHNITPVGALNMKREVTRPKVNLRGRLGHGVGIGTGAQPVDPSGRRQVGGGPEPGAPLLEGRGAVALGPPEVAKGGQGPPGQIGDLELEVPTGGHGALDQEVLSGVQVLRGGPGPGVPGLVTDAIF